MDSQQERAIYSRDYIHFDNLIWRLPMLSSFFFLLSLGVLLLVVSSTDDLGSLNTNVKVLSGVIALTSTLFLLACFNAIVRFRKHQNQLKPSRVTVFANWAFSGQTWLQLAVLAQVCVMFYIGGAALSWFSSSFPAFVLAGLLFAYSMYTDLRK